MFKSEESDISYKTTLKMANNPPHLIKTAQLLGINGTRHMVVKLPYVIKWTFTNTLVH